MQNVLETLPELQETEFWGLHDAEVWSRGLLGCDYE